MAGRGITAKGVSIAILVGVYAVALAVGWSVADATLSWGTWQAALAGDVAATLVVFAAAVALDNTSAYDPYWSVAPLPIAWFWLTHPDGVYGAEPTRGWLVLILLAAWGARLTWNFARGWPGLQHEDWRYDAYRRFGPVGYWALSLFGLHLMPTLVVFGALLPVYALSRGSGAPVGWLDAAAWAVAGGALGLETLADEQLRAFRASRPEPGAILKTGLWAYSRHPNYLGEIGFWWGIALFALAADPAGHAPYLLGAVAVTALFWFISIPLIDRRMLARRPAYAAHAARVPRLFPIPGRRAAD